MATPSDPDSGHENRAAACARGRPRLLSIHGAALGKSWRVEACGVVIGRDPARAGLVLPDPAISARHCALEFEHASGEYTVSDLGSRNGTHVNGEKIGERQLRDGDRLFVGETVLEFGFADELGAGFHSGVGSRLDIDALTGLLEKRAFDLELARAFALASQEQSPLSLLMMHAEEFEAIDPERAQRTSALCIAEIGRIIATEAADSGWACRYAASGFLAALHPLGRDSSAALADRIRERVASYSFERDGERVHASICIGIAEHRPGLPTPDHLLQAADEALLRARRAGRDQVSR